MRLREIEQIMRSRAYIRPLPPPPSLAQMAKARLELPSDQEDESAAGEVSQ